LQRKKKAESKIKKTTKKVKATKKKITANQKKLAALKKNPKGNKKAIKALEKKVRADRKKNAGNKVKVAKQKLNLVKVRLQLKSVADRQAKQYTDYLKIVDANLKTLKGADQAKEKKFRANLNKQAQNVRKAAALLSKKTTKAQLQELVKLTRSQAKFNEV